MQRAQTRNEFLLELFLKANSKLMPFISLQASDLAKTDRGSFTFGILCNTRKNIDIIISNTTIKDNFSFNAMVGYYFM
ncbi:hypothetical protein ACFLZV_00915 [Candidatus Margulisiibacteriota bacterium]